MSFRVVRSVTRQLTNRGVVFGVGILSITVGLVASSLLKEASNIGINRGLDSNLRVFAIRRFRVVH